MYSVGCGCRVCPGVLGGLLLSARSVARPLTLMVAEAAVLITVRVLALADSSIAVAYPQVLDGSFRQRRTVKRKPEGTVGF